MQKRLFAFSLLILCVTAALLTTFWFVRATYASVAAPDTSGQQNLKGLNVAPIITAITPDTAPNDLDTPVVISGTGFTAVISGTEVLTLPTVYLGSAAIQDVTWVNSTTLSATVPWGLDAGVYTLTVVNPDEGTGFLSNAFTVTQGIGVWSAGELFGGEFIQVAFHPTNPDIMYALSNGAGLFRSRDHGATWSLAYNRAQQDLAVSPAAPDRIYMQGAWAFQRSDDQGDTWVTLQPPYSNVPVHYTPLPHPTEPDTVFAAATSHIVDAQLGVVKSTDAGQTWIELTDGLTDTRVTALAFHPTNPLTMYAGTANGNVYISGDGGEHWAWASRPVEAVRTLVVEPWDDYSVWVDCPGGSLPNYCEMKRSLNAELTQWEAINPTPWPSFQGNVSFSPVQTGTIFIGTGGDRGWRTDDDGLTWSEFTNAEMAPIWFAFDQIDPETIFAADLSRGMFKSTDGGETWQVNNQGLAGMLPVQVAVPPGQPQEVYTTFDRWVELFKGSRGGSAWQPLPNGGDTTGYFKIDPFDPERIYRANQRNMCISQDGGQTWPVCSPFPLPDWCLDCISSPTDIAASPHQVGDLFTGLSFVHMNSPLWPSRGELYRSVDAGLTWELITFTQPISRVTNIVFDPVDSQMVYIATAGTGVLRSADNGQTWQHIDTDPPSLEYTVVIVEPVYPYRLIVPGSDGYFHTSIDHGDTWQKFRPLGLLDNIHQYLFTPEVPPVLYAGSPTGLIRSFDCGLNWSRMPGVLGYANIVSLDAVTVDERIILYLGTTGGNLEPLGSLVSMQTSQMITAGVYRYTTRSYRSFMPMIARDK
jgi:photosystem II stability/assembly factor-like uncharacterized protein